MNRVSATQLRFEGGRWVRGVADLQTTTVRYMPSGGFGRSWELVREKTMNAYLLAAAGLSAAGGVLHSVLGERLILSKLTAAGLPQVLGSSAFALRVLRLFWHLVSVAWWGFAGLLALLAVMPVSDEHQRLIWAIALTFLASAVLSLGVSRGKHFSWGVLLIVAVLAWLGGR